MIKIKLNNVSWNIGRCDELFSDKYVQKIFNNFNKLFVSCKVFNFEELENFALIWNADDYKIFYEMHDLEWKN